MRNNFNHRKIALLAGIFAAGMMLTGAGLPSSVTSARPELLSFMLMKDSMPEVHEMIGTPVTHLTEEQTKAAKHDAEVRKAEEQKTAKAAEEAEAMAEKEPAVADQYENLGVVSDCNNYLNVRDDASMKGKVIGKVLRYGGIEIVGEKDGWYELVLGEKTGYVAKEFIATGDEAAALAEEHALRMFKVNADILNVREEPTIDSRILTQLNVDDKYEVLDVAKGWVTLCIGTTDEGEDIIGYVYAKYVNIGRFLQDPIEWEPEPEVVETRGGSAANFALQYLGGAYVWGGETLGRGVDCSGFVKAVMANYGVYLPHSSAAQAGYGTPIGVGDLAPGDLIFYAGDGVNISHVAIYIGGGQIVHAASPSRGIIISPYNTMTPVRYTRVLG